MVLRACCAQAAHAGRCSIPSPGAVVAAQQHAAPGRHMPRTAGFPPTSLCVLVVPSPGMSPFLLSACPDPVVTALKHSPTLGVSLFGTSGVIFLVGSLALVHVDLWFSFCFPNGMISTLKEGERE